MSAGRIGRMGMLRVLALAAAWLALGGFAGATAETVSSTRLSYFTISGNTPAEIYRAILRRGPRVDGERAIASADATAVQNGRLEQSGGFCRVKDYRIKLTFRITRPRIANEGALSAGDRALWRQFSRFVVAHEEEHKRVWLACAADLDRRVRSVRAPNCDKAAAKTNAMWNQMLSGCDRKQRAFDADQARELRQQPFIRRALAGGR